MPVNKSISAVIEYTIYARNRYIAILAFIVPSIICQPPVIVYEYAFLESRAK